MLLLYLLIIVVWSSFTPFTFALWLNTIRFLRLDRRHSHNDPELVIVQITTNGKAARSVETIIETIRRYKLTFRHELWVVAEEHDSFPYHADTLLHIPSNWETLAHSRYKTRALEYARQRRKCLQLGKPSVKIVFLDDDSVPTKAYLEYAFHADFDICQGVLRPCRNYGSSLLASIEDNVRTADCLAFCLHFNLQGNARIIHGEGLVVRGHVEAAIGWDFGFSLAEDLIFGRRATKAFRFGFIPEFIEIEPPRNCRDFIVQRRRWFWGVAHAWPNLDASEKAFIVSRYLVGFLGALSLFLVGYTSLNHTVLGPWSYLFIVNSLGFFSFYAIGSWFNVHSFKETAKAVLLAIPASLLESVAIIVSLLTRPKGFEVIAKGANSS